MLPRLVSPLPASLYWCPVGPSGPPVVLRDLARWRVSGQLGVDAPDPSCPLYPRLPRCGGRGRIRRDTIGAGGPLTALRKGTTRIRHTVFLFGLRRQRRILHAVCLIRVL